MSNQHAIDIINDHEFKIKWWDLNHEAQKRLLNTIFGTEPIATAEFSYEEDNKQHIKEEK